MAFTLFPTTLCLAAIEWDTGQLCICYTCREAWSVHHRVHFDQKDWSSQKMWAMFQFMHDQSLLDKLAWGSFVAWPMRDRAGAMQADEHVAIFLCHCWCWVLTLVLQCRKKKVRVVSSVLLWTRQMLVASEEQGDYLLDVFEQCFMQRSLHWLDHEQQIKEWVTCMHTVRHAMLQWCHVGYNAAS